MPGNMRWLILSLPVSWSGCWGILAICRAAIWDGPCYASYDPEAYYNPGAGVFPWPEQVDGLLQAEGECSAQSVGKACLAGVASEAGDGFMQVFLNDFDARNPFVAGGRHAFVLKLGRVARYKGFSPEEMRLLQKAVVEKYAAG